jgi:hypothetical protein
VHPLLALLLALAAAAPARADAAATGAPRVVPRVELLAAMNATRGFEPTATTNGARFQAEVLLRLLRAQPSPEAMHLFVGYAEWYDAFLQRVALPRERAPAFARLCFENKQDLVIDARPGRVIESVLAGPAPRLAANVTIGWPAARGGPDRYSYDDTLSIPDLRVTNERVMTYRLLDYGDVVAFDDIRGLHGRPTEGVLGFLFQLVGEGSVRWSRQALSGDGLQVARARATKGLFAVESTITVFPDGRVQKDLPRERTDLEALEKRLLETRTLRYRPLARERAPAEVVAQP